MSPPFRISTSPPSFSDREESADGSYYCDLYPLDEWRSYSIIQSLSGEHIDSIVNAGLIAYRAIADDDKEFAILVCVEEDENVYMYYAIDHSGRVEHEPAANEALWHPANAALALPRGYRLGRKVVASPLKLIN